MLPFDQIAPTIPLLNILRKGEETIARTMAVYTVIAVITAKRRTVLSSPFRYSVRRISGGRIFIHCQKKCNNFATKPRESRGQPVCSLKLLFDSHHGSLPASLSC